MKVYYADKPHNHHFFLLTVDEMHRDATLLRFDNHPDIKGDSPCSNYVSKVKYCFRNVVWVNKPDDNFKFTVYSDRKAHADSPSGFSTVNSFDELISRLKVVLMSKVIIDVDPDVIKDYPCNYPTACMSCDELSSLINYVNNDFEVLYFFFASPKVFAEDVVSGTGFKDFEFIHLDDPLESATLEAAQQD